MQLLGGQSTLVVIGVVCQSHCASTVQLMGNAADAVAMVIRIGVHFGQGRLSVCRMGMRYGSGPVCKRVAYIAVLTYKNNSPLLRVTVYSSEKSSLVSFAKKL